MIKAVKKLLKQSAVLVEIVRANLGHFAPEQRLALLELMGRGFCTECGGHLSEKSNGRWEACLCTRDE